MNRFFIAVIVWLVVLGRGTAQVALEVVFEQDQFLRSESMVTKVRVLNSSGQTLHLGEEPGWLAFDVRDAEGRDVRNLAPVPLVDAFDLASSKVANLTVDLMPYYDLSKLGQYTLNVSLKVSQLGRTFASPSKPFHIINGTKIWEREFGIPAAGVPEVRKYALQQANFINQLRLYARITDPDEQKVFRVVQLGPLVSFSKVEALLDKSSNLHILFQTHARLFLYEVLNPDGDVLTHLGYEYTETSKPSLRSTDEKGVHVAGGRRRVLLSDYPPPAEEPPPSAVETPSTNQPPAVPPATNQPPAKRKK